MVLDYEKRFSEAEKLNRQVLEAQRQTLGPENASTLLTLGNLGYVLIEEKNYPEAEKILREALAGLRRVLGPSHDVTAGAAYKLALVLALEGSGMRPSYTCGLTRRLLVPSRISSSWKRTQIINFCVQIRASTLRWPPHASASPRRRCNRRVDRRAVAQDPVFTLRSLHQTTTLRALATSLRSLTSTARAAVLQNSIYHRSNVPFGQHFGGAFI
ncbi:MAG: tetratricopeptide repeat protein [Acidobacteriales bacterium]|nr:tetratricopeptide repeat protein [Terriglobales bacterium]